MNKKISRVLGIVVTLTMLASLLVWGSPVSAGTLAWSDETEPSTTGNFLDADSDILDIAVNGDTIYAVIDSDGDGTGDTFRRSTNGGATFSARTLPDTGASVLAEPKLVAVTPDDADVIVVVDGDDEEVYFSDDGGATFDDLNLPGAGFVSQSIDVVDNNGVYKIAVSGADAGNAALFTFDVAIAAVWTDVTTAAGDGFLASDTMPAVKFSPSHGSDSVIVVVTENGSAATFQMFRDDEDDWNDQIAYLSGDADWADGIEISDTIAGTLAADIVLDNGYVGSDSNSRVGFIALASTTAADEDGAFRIDDSQITAFETWSGGDEGGIFTVAFNGEILLAGDGDDSQVYWSTDPLDTEPKFGRVTTLKQPGGENFVLVGWADDTAVAATRGNESAFAVSTDDGVTFNDVSLIDTALTNIRDVAVSADGSVIYLSTNNGADASIFIKEDSTWTRVYSDQAAVDLDYLVRLDPEDPAVVYMATAGTDSMWVSKDSGKASWKAIPVYRLDDIVDFVVVDDSTVYAIDADEFSKTTNTGASWSAVEDPGITAETIVLAPNGDILISGNDGGEAKVAFSTDDGDTFDETRSAGAATDGVFVAADPDFADNNIIYIGYDDFVARGEASTTAYWTGTTGASVPADLSPDIDGSVTGMVQSGSVTYVLESDGTDSAVWRALNLKAATSATGALWSSRDADASAFDAVPQALTMSVSDSTVKLWAIDTDNGDFMSFTDGVALIAPTMVSPDTAAVVRVNPGSGNPYNVTFSWQRQNTSVTEIELQIATDEDFNAIIFEDDFAANSATTATIIGPTAANAAAFIPGQTYYWRIRTSENGPMFSPWSETREFTIIGAESLLNIESPAIGATGVATKPTLVWSAVEGSIRYEVQVNTSTDFTVPAISDTSTDAFFVVPSDLTNGQTYYWRVRAITSEGAEGEPAVGGPWVGSTFTVIGEGGGTPAPTSTVTVTNEVPVPLPTPIPTYLLWIIVGIGAILVIALIVLIVRTRRVP